MAVRNWVVALFVMVGVALIGYGVVVGDEGTISIELSEPTNESNLESDIAVTEYDYLTPEHQDAFRKALQTSDSVEVDEAPEPQGDYIEYRDNYYRLYVEYATASQTTMVFSIAAGIILLLIGGGGWVYSNRLSEGGT